VSRPRIELEPVTPWSLRLLDALPVPAFWGGVAIGAGVFAVFLLFTAVWGESAGRLAGLSFEGRWAAEAIQDLFLGFAVAVTGASVRRARVELEALRPSLVTPMRDASELHGRVLSYPRGALAAIGATSLLSALATVKSPSLWEGGAMPGWSHPTVWWLFARSGLTWWVALRGMALELILGLRFSRLADGIERVAPGEREVFAPFARRALRNVALWMLLAAWISLTWVGPGWAVPFLMALGVISLAAFAVAAFLLPLLGPHRRLQAAKRAELARVRSALAPARDAVLRAGPLERTGGRLADLVAYEARVAAADEWPIEGGTWLRFALFLALGLGSWVGAGLVQHLIELALGDGPR
jgi:hypothetical protein